MDRFRERLTQVLAGRSVNAFGVLSGVPESALRKYLAGTVPGLDKAVAIAQAAGVSLDWLAGLTPDAAEPGGRYTATDVVWLPRYERWPEDGAVEGGAAELVPFSRRWLDAAGARAGSTLVVAVSGDAMAPVLRAGDWVLVARAPTGAVTSGLAVVADALGALVVVRLQVAGAPDGSAWLLSDNTAYPQRVVALGSLRVWGFVVAVVSRA